MFLTTGKNHPILKTYRWRIQMTYGEKAAARIFFVVGFFLGGLGGLTLGHDMTIKDLTNEKNHPITYLNNGNERDNK